MQTLLWLYRFPAGDGVLIRLLLLLPYPSVLLFYTLHWTY
jgi:hypothetical protein